MSNESVIKTKVTKKNLVIEIPREFIINDFNQMCADFKVKGNRKNKFVKEVAEQLAEHIVIDDVLMMVYDELYDSENVKCIEECE